MQTLFLWVALQKTYRVIAIYQQDLGSSGLGLQNQWADLFLFAIISRMNFRFVPISFSMDPVGLVVSSCAHASNPMSASASTTAVKSILPWPRKCGLSLR